MTQGLGNIIRSILAAAALAGLAAPGAAQPFDFAAVGDTPYFLPADYGRFSAVIAAINQRNPAFTIHVGDIKSGSTLCSDELLGKAAEQLKEFDGPLVYTPGDNEWTDCHRANNGGFDPLER